MGLSARFTRIGSNLLIYGLLGGVSVFMILPFLWMLDTSLKPAAETFANPPIIISANFSLNAYRTLINDFNILRVLGNTFVIALSATGLQLFFCSLGGYGFAKY